MGKVYTCTEKASGQGLAQQQFTPLVTGLRLLTPISLLREPGFSENDFRFESQSLKGITETYLSQQNVRNLQTY
jgi:hypothetical protein